jgi:hypothetical protein
VESGEPGRRTRGSIVYRPSAFRSAIISACPCLLVATSIHGGADTTQSQLMTTPRAAGRQRTVRKKVTMHVCTYSTTRQVTATFSGSEGSGPLTRGPRLAGPTCQWPFSTPFSRPKPTERNFHDLKKNEVVPEIGWLGTYARTNVAWAAPFSPLTHAHGMVNRWSYSSIDRVGSRAPEWRVRCVLGTCSNDECL